MAKLNNNQKAYIDDQPTFNGKLITELGYDPYYEKVKESPNEIFELYYEDIQRLIGRCSVKWNINPNELYSDAYIYFIQACKKYTPYVLKDNSCKFYPAKNYIMNYINWYYKNYPKIHDNKIGKYKEVTIGIVNNVGSDLKDVDSSIMEIRTAITESQIPEYELTNIINELPEKFRDCIKLSIQGDQQWKIAQKLGISQTRVSQMFKKMRDAIENRNDPNIKDRLLKYEEIDVPSIKLFDYCHDNNIVDYIPKKNNKKKEIEPDDKRLKINNK